MNVLPPVRVRRESTLRLVAPPRDVFPMLCPVREVEWTSDWDPYVVWARSGVAEPDCVFITRDGDAESIWVITEHDPESHYVEMIKVTPGVTVAKLEFGLEAEGDDATRARVAYTHTALGRAGQEFVAGFSEEHWNDFTRTMESELNHYLGSGGSPDDGEFRFE